MNIRKVKKKVKFLYSDDAIIMRRVLSNLPLIKIWSKIDHPNSKSNMRIITGNFYRKGNFIY